MLTKKNTLLLIANAAKAKIYEVKGRQCLPLQELDHPPSRLKSQHLSSDKPGYYESSYQTQGKFIPPTDPHKKEHIRFAKVITDCLEKIINEKTYHHMILCAEPYFHGLLKQAFSKSIKHLTTKVIEKDYIPLPKNKLDKVIEDIVHEPI